MRRRVPGHLFFLGVPLEGNAPSGYLGISSPTFVVSDFWRPASRFSFLLAGGILESVIDLMIEGWVADLARSVQWRINDPPYRLKTEVLERLPNSLKKIFAFFASFAVNPRFYVIHWISGHCPQVASAEIR